MSTINAAGAGGALVGTERFPGEGTPFDGTAKGYWTPTQIKTFALSGLAGTIVSYTPAGGIAATTLSGAITELDTEKANIASPTFTGTVGGITATMIASSATGDVAATTVQAAIAELASEKAALGGATFTGPIQTTAGTMGTPGLQIGDADTGLRYTSGHLLADVDGVNRININSTDFSFTSVSGSAAKINSISDGGGSQIIATNYIASSSSPLFRVSHARGSLASPGDLVTSDQIYVEQGQGYGGGAFRTAYQMTVTTTETTPSGTAMGARIVTSLAAIGSVSVTEISRFEHATGFSMFGANPVIDQNRIHRQRSYTIATLPTQTAGMSIYCSDLGGGGGLLISDGTNFRRTSPGQQTLATDAAFTLTPLTIAEEYKHTGTLTADRALTLSTTNAYSGARFRLTRTGGGAFNITHALKNIATNQWAEFVYDGSAWYLAAYGAL